MDTSASMDELSVVKAPCDRRRHPEWLSTMATIDVTPRRRMPHEDITTASLGLVSASSIRAIIPSLLDGEFLIESRVRHDSGYV